MNKLLYNTILSVTFSPCGDYLLAGNVHGDIVLMNLNSLMNDAADVDEYNDKITRKMFSLASDQKTHIYSITSSDQFLIIGLRGEIVGWKWQDILDAVSGHMPPNAWKIRIPSSKNENNICEVNSLTIDEKSNVTGDTLYAGCGDNNVYSFSLEDGQHFKTYSGHSDYVHNIDIRENLIVSGSEDGSVRIYDSRTSDIVNTIEPYRHKEISRSYLGNWIGDVSLNEDWLVCGGGARLSLWNLRTMDCPMTVFSRSMDNGIHVTRIHQNDVLAGGLAPYFSILGYNDELRTRIQSSNSIVYSCAISVQNSREVLSLVGNSNDIDISTNFRYREYTVPFY